MAKGKKLRKLRDADYGFTLGCNIHINVEKIWDESRCFEKFAKKFSKIFMHETLHLLLKDIRPKRLIGEEKTVHKMCREQWTKETQKLYAELYA